MSWVSTSEEYCSLCGKITFHMNGYCQEKHELQTSYIKFTVKGKNGRRREKVYNGEETETIKIVN